MLFEIIFFLLGLVSCYFWWYSGNYFFGIIGIGCYMFGLYYIYFHWRVKYRKISRLKSRNKNLKQELKKMRPKKKRFSLKKRAKKIPKKRKIHSLKIRIKKNRGKRGISK